MTHAAIFDAADYIEPGHYAAGVYSEFLLNNPSGEGIEVRGKRGINDLVNFEPFLGFGTRSRGFRFGASATVNFFPSTDSQPGISLMGTGQYVRRETYNGLNFSAAPMIHKRVEGADHLPLNLYLAFPFSLELWEGHYRTGLQAAFGGLYDIDSSGTYYLVAEAGVSLNNSESLVLLGGGIRFSNERSSFHAVSWKNKDEQPAKAKDREEPAPNVKQTKAVDESDEYEPEEAK